MKAAIDVWQEAIKKASGCCHAAGIAYPRNSKAREVAMALKYQIRDLQFPPSAFATSAPEPGKHLLAENERLKKWQAKFEEAEASVCPEDVGFEEYIRHLLAKLALAAENAAGMEETAARLREALERIVQLNDKLPDTHPGRLSHGEYEQACAALKVAP